MAAFLHPSEKAKVDDVLRLPGLKFHQSDPVIDKNNIDLMIALGAIDTKRGGAGSQIVVVRRLAFLYQTILLIHKEIPALDINSDQFYTAALLSVLDKYRDVYKNVTPQSFRHVIELYRKAFARSGFKVISKSTEIQDAVGDRAQLEELVKEWMKVRGTAREANTTNKNSVFHLFEDVDVPQQKPDETLDSYMLRIHHEFQQLNRDTQADKHVLSYVSEQRRERLDAQHDQIAEYEKLLDQRRERLDEQHDQIEHYKKCAARLQEHVATFPPMEKPNFEMLPKPNDQGNKLGEVEERQAVIMEMEIDGAYRQDTINNKLEEVKGAQEDINDKLDQVMEGQDDIVDIQTQLTEEMRRTRWTQGFVVARQNEVMRRQAEVMDRQDDVMYCVREMMLRHR